MVFLVLHSSTITSTSTNTLLSSAPSPSLSALQDRWRGQRCGPARRAALRAAERRTALGDDALHGLGPHQGVPRRTATDRSAPGEKRKQGLWVAFAWLFWGVINVRCDAFSWFVMSLWHFVDVFH